MKTLLILISVAVLVSGCAPHGTATPMPAPTPTTPNMRIDAWVDNPTPALGSNVVVHFNFLNEDVPVNWMVMIAEWQQGGARQQCVSQVQYDMGQCAIPVDGMAPGVYVPVTVTTEYIGWTFYGYTGFTPQ